MEAGIETTMRNAEWIVGLIDADYEVARPKTRGPYKKSG